MICARLKELKEQKKLTNQELSNLSGVPIATINRLMSGATENPTIDTVLALASALGTTVDSLLGLSPPSGHGDESPLIALYEKRIAEKYAALRVHSRWLRFLCALSLVLFLFIIAWLVIDVLNPKIGWFR